MLTCADWAVTVEETHPKTDGWVSTGKSLRGPLSGFPGNFGDARVVIMLRSHRLGPE